MLNLFKSRFSQDLIQSHSANSLLSMWTNRAVIFNSFTLEVNNLH